MHDGHFSGYIFIFLLKLCFVATVEDKVSYFVVGMLKTCKCSLIDYLFRNKWLIHSRIFGS